MQRLLLADALKIKPSSTNFRYLLSASLRYGLTEGTEKAPEIKLTPLGQRATNPDPEVRRRAEREAVMTPLVFKQFFEDYANAKLPATDLLAKVLSSNYSVPPGSAVECAGLIIENGTAVGLIRDISGSPHVMLDGDVTADVTGQGDEAHPDDRDTELDGQDGVGEDALADPSMTPAAPGTPGLIAEEERLARSIFIGHGKKHGPLDKLEKILGGFKIPFKVATTEPNLGRPIPQKVKEIMLECGSAILIFTKDEKFHDANGNEVWRPSENVVHELGAASFQYEDRVVIFKEKGINFPSNYSSVGYIEFEEDAIEAKAIELLKELIGFGIVKVTPT